MATRMTKTQIDYIREKLNRKVKELVKREEEKNASIIDETQKLLKSLSYSNFIVWLRKKATKAQILSVIENSGGVLMNSAITYRYCAHDHITTKLKAVISGISEEPNECIKSFYRSIKAKEKAETILKRYGHVELLKKDLQNQCDAILDKAVFAGSPDEIAKPIEDFLAK